MYRSVAFDLYIHNDFVNSILETHFQGSAQKFNLPAVAGAVTVAD